MKRIKGKGPIKLVNNNLPPEQINIDVLFEYLDTVAYTGQVTFYKLF